VYNSKTFFFVIISLLYHNKIPCNDVHRSLNEVVADKIRKYRAG
jgi:hypothetical protein